MMPFFMQVANSEVHITFDDKEGRDVYRHSTSHIMAHAVKELFPDAKLAIGPAIEDGFYYDFDYHRHFTPEDLIMIEERMREIIKADRPFVRKEIDREEAISYFKSREEPYKIQLIEEIKDKSVSLYQEGDFVDLCLGPHIPSTGKVKTFKLLSVAGAYWRGDERNRMLQRIYGTSFSKEEDLEAYLKKLEEIKKRDHRNIGRELGLFSINEETGAGLILWHPRGALIRKTIEDFWREEHYRWDYDLVYSPHIAKLDLWKKSGHIDFYRENMYSPMEIDNIDYELKPMNCPFHIMIYKSEIRSYRNLPIRYAELGTVYRYERSGVLHGLLRVRGFTQDDAHIFCREDQLPDEIQRVLDFTVFVLKTFGFHEYDIFLSTRPEEYVGTLENWEKATSALKMAIEKKGLSYRNDIGAGVFYGPKIDIKVKDAIGRAWQCSTIQVDFNLPERFDITYRGEDGKEHQPIMIHRALMGSLERFFGVLIEHYAGAFPLWLSPVQVRVLSITDSQMDYARKIKDELRSIGIRTEADLRNEKIGLKIREGSIEKIPYLLIIGEKEKKGNTVNVRKRGGENLGEMTLPEIIERLKKEIEEKL
ncbi:MAG: threonine--tRNA ligase [Nitrospirae bacterium]|nr:threonine--tRNA ligase [Nitrospirota bacterium]